MMKRLIAYTIATILAIFLISCQSDKEALGISGALYLSVDQDETIRTKASLEVTDELLTVAILTEEGDTVNYYEDFLTEVKDQKMLLPIGNYTLSVRSAQSNAAGWEKPFYAGEETITIKAGEITSAKVICTIANTKVAVEYAPDLALYFSNYETTVKNSSGSLLYTRDEFRAGFFKAEKLYADLYLVNKDGNTFNMQRVFTDIKPQYYYKIRYALDPGTGEGDAGADFDGIQIEENADTLYYGIYIKQEDLYNKRPAVLTLSGFAENKLTFKKTEDLVVPQNSLHVTAENGIKQFQVVSNSHQLTGNMAAFDLCNLTADQTALLKQMNFPVQDVKDEKEVKLDLTAFASILLPLSETELATHTLTVNVLDNLHQESTVSFTYEVRPDVAAYVSEPTCWTTFAVLSGNCLDETSYFVVQSAGGANQNVKTLTRDSDGNMKALVIGLIPGLTYTYWLESEEDSEMTCSPISFSTLVATAVPNLGFEDWTDQTSGYLDAPLVGGNKTYISPNKDKDNVFWDSGNLGAKAASLILTDKIKEPAIANSEFVAILKSTWAGALGMGAFAAGSVYSGYPVNVSTSGATLSYGRSYQGYPSNLSGYYKYTPGKVDYYDSRTPADGLKKDDMDQCIIYIALCTKPFDVISTTKEIKPFPKDDPAVFAYGEYISGTTEDRTGETPSEETLNGYAPFKIALTYRKETPTTGSFYVVIMASASRSGDYFTGSTQSVMWIDELSLNYDYDADSFSELGLSSLTPIQINE